MNLGNQTLNPESLAACLTVALLNKLKVLIVSYPGVGKTEIVKQTVAALGYDLIIFHPAISDPTDFKGMPCTFQRNGEQVAEFMPFGDLNILFTAQRPTVVFIEDCGQAPFSVQAALMQPIQERRVNGRKISEHILFVAATNDPTMKAGVVGLIEPFKSRWDTIVTLGVSQPHWENHAASHRYYHTVVNFIKAFPSMLHPLTLGTPEVQKRYTLSTKELTNMPCPRTVESVSKWEHAYEGKAPAAVIDGAVGEGWRLAYVAYRAVYSEFPDPLEIIKNPTTALVPTNPSALYAVTTALAFHASEEHSDAIVTYGERIAKSIKSGKPFEVRLHQLALRYDKGFWGPKAKKAQKWGVENAQFISAALFGGKAA